MSNSCHYEQVSYTDNDVEVLNLREEKWEFRSDLMPDGVSKLVCSFYVSFTSLYFLNLCLYICWQEQATECHSPDPSPEM